MRVALQPTATARSGCAAGAEAKLCRLSIRAPAVQTLQTIGAWVSTSTGICPAVDTVAIINADALTAFNGGVAGEVPVVGAAGAQGCFGVCVAHGSILGLGQVSRRACKAAETHIA